MLCPSGEGTTGQVFPWLIMWSGAAGSSIGGRVCASLVLFSGTVIGGEVKMVCTALRGCGMLCRRMYGEE